MRVLRTKEGEIKVRKGGSLVELQESYEKLTNNPAAFKKIDYLDKCSNEKANYIRVTMRTGTASDHNSGYIYDYYLSNTIIEKTGAKTIKIGVPNGKNTTNLYDSFMEKDYLEFDVKDIVKATKKFNLLIKSEMKRRILCFLKIHKYYDAKSEEEKQERYNLAEIQCEIDTRIDSIFCACDELDNYMFSISCGTYGDEYEILDNIKI